MLATSFLLIVSSTFFLGLKAGQAVYEDEEACTITGATFSKHKGELTIHCGDKGEDTWVQTTTNLK